MLKLQLALSLFSEPIGRGEKLVIWNVSVSDDDMYQCVAFNGVPPSSTKLIRVSVECKFFSRLNTRLFSQ